MHMLPSLNSSDDTSSPTALIGLNTRNVLMNRYPPGNSESTRQLLLRMRVCEERNTRLNFENHALKDDKHKLEKKLTDLDDKLLELQKEHAVQIEALKKELRETIREQERSKFDTLIKVLLPDTEQKKPKVYESPYKLPPEPEHLPKIDEATETDDVTSEAAKDFDAQEHPRRLADPLEVAECVQLREEKLKLENALFTLETKQKLMQFKIDKYMLLETKKKTLENRLLSLNDINTELINENECLKQQIAEAKRPAKPDQTVEDSSEASANKVCLEGSQSEKASELMASSRRVKELEARLSSESSRYELLEKQFNELRNKHDLLMQQSGHLSQQNGESTTGVLMKKIDELKARLAKYEPEGPGSDTTKIIHFCMNPLDVAHEDYMESEKARKRRKISYETNNDDSLDVSVRRKIREEMNREISELQYQLMKASKEKEKALKIQSDLIKKYRSVVTALSGLQIKMKDDDFVQVQSIFEKDRSLDFMFKVEDWGNNVSLLETEYVSRWSDHVKEYLEDRHSVPAFLAAVTLALDREAGGADHHSRLARTNTST